MGADNPNWVNFVTHKLDSWEELHRKVRQRRRPGRAPEPEREASPEERSREAFARSYSRQIKMIGSGTGRRWAFFEDEDAIVPLFEGTMTEVLDAGIRWEANRNAGGD